MPKLVVVDTDVMVDFLRGYPKAVSLINQHSSRVVLSTIVLSELYAGIRGNEELQTLDDLVTAFRIATITTDIAKSGGLHKRDYARSHGVGLADALIAATVESEDAELFTLNVKHFPMFAGLKPAYTK